MDIFNHVFYFFKCSKDFFSINLSDILLSLILQSVVLSGSHSWWLVLLDVWLFFTWCWWLYTWELVFLESRWSPGWSCFSWQKVLPLLFLLGLVPVWNHFQSGTPLWFPRTTQAVWTWAVSSWSQLHREGFFFFSCSKYPQANGVPAYHGKGLLLLSLPWAGPGIVLCPNFPIKLLKSKHMCSLLANPLGVKVILRFETVSFYRLLLSLGFWPGISLLFYSFFNAVKISKILSIVLVVFSEMHNTNNTADLPWK